MIGTGLYYYAGKNAWYFQLLEQGEQPDKAREEAQKAGQEIFPAGSTKESLLISARIWKTWLLTAIYFTTFGGFIALTAWLPSYWQGLFEVSATTAGLLTALYSILTSVIRVVGGSVSDRLGGERTAMLSLLTMGVGAVLMTVSQIYGLSVFAEILMALGMGVGNAAVFKLVPQEVPDAVGGAAGWVGGLGAFGGFVIPPLMGTFVRDGNGAGYAQGFLVYVALAAISFSMAYVLRRSRR